MTYTEFLILILNCYELLINDFELILLLWALFCVKFLAILMLFIEWVEFLLYALQSKSEILLQSAHGSLYLIDLVDVTLVIEMGEWLHTELPYFHSRNLLRRCASIIEDFKELLLVFSVVQHATLVSGITLESDVLILLVNVIFLVLSWELLLRWIRKVKTWVLRGMKLLRLLSWRQERSLFHWSILILISWILKFMLFQRTMARLC